MGTVIAQTTYEALPAAVYRAKLAAAVVEDGEYGKQVAARFDLLDEGFEDRSVRAWASAKLSGGKRPSKLWGWTSALLFNGKGLPEGYDLDLDTLLDREALLVVEVVQKDGVDRNRVAQLLPLRPVKATVKAAPAPTADSLLAEDRAILKPRSGVPVLAQPVPDDVPEWLNSAGDGFDTLP
jgi:hypothetical protein